MNDIILSTQNGEPVASSRDVAKRFGKEHRNVMRDIENLMSEGVLKIEQTPLFFKSEYTHPQNHQKYPMYLMKRDGFSLLAMGFTGKEAVQWKLKSIEAMQKVADGKATKIIIPSELQNLGGVVPAIKELVTEPRKEE